MTDARVVFIALIVLFIMVLGYWSFTLLIGGFLKPFIDDHAPAVGEGPIDRTEFLRLSDRFYSTKDAVFFIGLALPLFGAVVYYLYSREESPFGG